MKPEGSNEDTSPDSVNVSSKIERTTVNGGGGRGDGGGGGGRGGRGGVGRAGKLPGMRKIMLQRTARQKEKMADETRKAATVAKTTQDNWLSICTLNRWR